MSQSIEQLLSDRTLIGRLPHSKCRNCKGDLRLYEGRWYHIDMAGGQYYQPFNNGCERPYPLRCAKCEARLDYKTLEPMYYDFKCQKCIEKEKQGDQIGVLTDEMKRKLRAGKGDYLKYGTMCAVVLTKNGLWFVDIC